MERAHPSGTRPRETNARSALITSASHGKRAEKREQKKKIGALSFYAANGKPAALIQTATQMDIGGFDGHAGGLGKLFENVRMTTFAIT